MRLQLLQPDHKLQHDVHQLLCLPEVYEYLADGEAPPPGVAEAWLAESPQDWHRCGGGLWALRPDNSEAAILGLVRLSDYADGHADGQLELTYLLHPSQWRTGLTTRMAHSAMHICFQRGEVNMIWAGADEPNVGSIGVMRRLGMSFRRTVAYPSGTGVEYEMSAVDFDPDRFERLEIAA